jgi:branched-chain amino acid transport system ATP-binding protein
MASPCLVLDQVSCVFGGLTAVDRVSLRIGAGERRAVIGPNGAGKTTLFNVISGEVLATRGTIILDGADVTGLLPHQRAAHGMARTFQITKLFANLTVEQNLLLACEALDRRKFAMHVPLSSCASITKRASAVIEQFGLSSRRHQLARHLAYGEQRKLEVALSMAGRPRLLLLDEPMAGLSSSDRETMTRLIGGIDREIAVLLIEHDMDVAFGFGDRVTVLSRGRVLAEGGKDEIAANPDVQEIYLGRPGLDQ